MQEFGTGSLAELVRSAHDFAARTPGVPADGGYEKIERAAERVARASLAGLPQDDDFVGELAAIFTDGLAVVALEEAAVSREERHRGTRAKGLTE